MRIIFLGAPGSGKGTQGDKLVQDFDYQLLTTSTILRAYMKSGGALCAQMQADMDAGKLVSDNLVWQVMSQAIMQYEQAGKNIILDGFPRSTQQYDYLNSGDSYYDFMFYFAVSESVVIQRLSGRRVHLPSGRVYHVDYAPPRVAGVDDVTGEPLVHRADDQPGVIIRRLATYKEKTLPLLDSVRKNITHKRGKIKALITINADQSIAAVAQELEQHLAS